MEMSAVATANRWTVRRFERCMCGIILASAGMGKGAE
jgi:hypothetical protein